MGTKEVPRYYSSVCLSVVHYRYKLADPDNLNAKAFIDGIVKAGILADDSAKEISEVRHRQVKISKPEKEYTTVEIVRVKS